MAHILLVDDEPGTRESVRRILEDDGHLVSEAGDGQACLDWLKQHTPDLIVLDIIMPGMSGIDVCRRLRADPFFARLPVILLTAKSRPSDVAAGLDAGADDYITKPIEVIELPARVRACLRRSAGGAFHAETDTVEVGDLSLNLTELEVDIAGKRISLSGTEHRLLHALMVRASQPVSIDRLLQDVWQYPPGVGDPSLVYAHIKNLRQKIEPDSNVTPKYLRNVRGRGYMISG